MVVLTAEKKAGNGSPAGARGGPAIRPPPQPRPQAGPPPSSRPAERAARPPQKAGVPGVDAIVAVASGKGGVGKSTTPSTSRWR
jgi:ATP-binding protein involved in chromosome partitioning